MKHPRVIFLDAVGTLFGVKGSVGEIYGLLARQFGVTVEAEILDAAFFQSFQAASPMAFPRVSQSEIPEREFAWWWAIAAQTFQKAGVLDQFTDFSAFFTVLYSYFETAEPWLVYPDIRSTLTQWCDQGIELGIVSNFDSRIYVVLSALELAEFFSSVTISTEVGVAKPDPQVFVAALQKHNCSPEEAWHIGDSFKEDYEGAKAAGLRAIWLKRNSVSVPTPSLTRATGKRI
jgi:putative hydrolase of the HAD superfamily